MLTLILPDLVLIVAGSALLLLGAFAKPAARKIAPVVALAALVGAIVVQVLLAPGGAIGVALGGAVRITQLSIYIKLVTALMGGVLVLMAWPSRANAAGNESLDLGDDGGEFFGLALLSLAGVFLVSGADDTILLLLALELVSIPTYIMVSISRPLPAAQEAGVKYFFLGAMAAALMLFGFSYLYGTTGTVRLSQMGPALQGALGQPSPWQMMGVLVLLAGFAFKIAAVPLHFYVGDVYEGAATPVTAFLAFVPKISGFVAIIKVLGVVAGPQWLMPISIVKLLWVLAVLTMTVGNVLALLQHNVKRVLAYSSVAHSGYMLVGLAALAGAADAGSRLDALRAVLFYIAGYGLMNAAAFMVLMLLPARQSSEPATTAETYEDLAGTGRQNLGLGLAMAVACFSLIGIPLTVGFLGKLLLIKPALAGGSGSLVWLAIITVVNAAISAAYYLRIVGAMFLRPQPQWTSSNPTPRAIFPLRLALGLAVAGTLVLGSVPPAAQILWQLCEMGALAASIR